MKHSEIEKMAREDIKKYSGRPLTEKEKQFKKLVEEKMLETNINEFLEDRVKDVAFDKMSREELIKFIAMLLIEREREYKARLKEIRDRRKTEKLIERALDNYLKKKRDEGEG